MSKVFDATFVFGFLFVVASLVVAALALTGRTVPLVGAGRGALIAVAVLGLSGCAVAGVSQTNTYSWTHPVMLIGVALGVVATAVILAGIFGWDGVVRPLASVGPIGALAATTEDLAVAALALLIALSFAINLAFSLIR